MMKKFLMNKMPQTLLVFVNILSMFLLYFYKERFDKSILISVILLVATIYISNYILLKISSGDHYLFLVVSMLSSIGIIMIYRLNPVYGFRQIIWFGVGIVFYFIFYFCVKRIKGWKKWLNGYFIISMILFVVTQVLGTKIKGATNWIRIGGIGIQPSEIIKIIFVFYLASYYTNYTKKANEKYKFLGVVYSYIAFLFIQRDLGTAMIFCFVFFIILYIYEEDRKLIYYQIIGGLIIGIVSSFLIHHVQVRFIAWFNPWEYIEKEGYQITQSLFAIGAGGFFGTGIGLGHPEFIPEVHTDFIFSAICEEMGIFGGIAVIMLFLILVYRGFKIALNQYDKFFKIVAIGITTTLGFQAFIIVGGVIKMIPLTGVTLPFVSYGGSSLVASFAALGILQVASEEIQMEQEEGDGYNS
ncbi:FtsW/RodA/SpoVE family cell cycle protein [Lutibacter sp. B2]|nr:FtsW/RodA/SpoVE family cell cycle protein [Lutibacter sp. B2]